MHKLSARRVATERKTGMHGDGGGLYLCVGGNDGSTPSRSWIFRGTVKGRTTSSGQPYRVEIGLGSASDVSLAEAREAAGDMRKLVRQGINPLDERRREALTFEQAARRLHAELLPTWRAEKHGQIWLNSLENHVFPVIGQRLIESLGTADVLAVLSPVWTEKHDTARRLRQRMAAVFDWAKGHGHYRQENPVNGTRKALPTVRHRAEHMASLPWQELPGFMADLARREGVSARTLEFLILTATRSGEARGARWSEIDRDAAVWTIPGERMKTGQPHRVPLSPAALAVLDGVKGLDEDLVFPSLQRGSERKSKEQSINVFQALLRRMKREGLTVHGFRSTFRVWCDESARADRNVAEASLAHVVGNRVEKAYARSDLFERRRELLERWADYANSVPASVVALRSA